MPNGFGPLSGLGALTGQAVGTGISGLLQELTPQKKAAISKDQWKSIGATDEEAEAFSRLPLEQQSVAFQDLLKRRQQLGTLAGEQRAYENLFGVPSTPAPSLPTRQQITQQKKEILEPSLEISERKEEFELSPEILQSLREKKIVTPNEYMTELIRQGVDRQTASQTARLYADEYKQKEKSKQEDIKESKKFYKELKSDLSGARDSVARLDRMEELIRKGKLPSPSTASILNILEHAGLGNWSGLLTADAQEFQKLSTDFLKNARSIFGARVTNFEVNQFLKTLPTLLQSDEGKRRVIANMRQFLEGKFVKERAANAIIEAAGEKIPPDLDRLVDKATEKQINEIYSNFKNAFDIQERKSGKISSDILNALGDPRTLTPGKKRKDKQTGKIYQVIGNEWVEVG